MAQVHTEGESTTLADADPVNMVSQSPNDFQTPIHERLDSEKIAKELYSDDVTPEMTQVKKPSTNIVTDGVFRQSIPQSEFSSGAPSTIQYNAKLSSGGMDVTPMGSEVKSTLAKDKWSSAKPPKMMSHDKNSN